MAQTINADDGSVSGSAGLKSSSDGTAVLTLQTKGTDALTINASANIGVGTTSPAAPLHVRAASNEIMRLQSSDATTGNLYFTYYDSAAAEKGFVGYGASGNDNFYLWNSENAAILFGVNNGTAMTLDASGNLLVGTTTPTYRFTVVGSTSDATPVANFRGYATGNDGDRTAILRFTSSTDLNWAVARYDAWSHLWHTNGSERARITSGGDLLVGATSATNTASTGARLYANGAIATTRSESTDSTGNLTVYSTGAAATRFYVGMGGTVYATNTTISAISDQRHKENIRDLDIGLDAVLALKPRKFDWKAGKGKDIKDDRGFIAQEFEQVFPDLVDEWKDPAPEGEEPYKSVRQDLIPVLVKAIQEQQSMINDLKAKVAALESK